MDSKTGEHLIFLVSQPRAGSSLLQRILAKHPKIYAASETWLMLHPIFALRRMGLRAEYSPRQESETALREFLRALPNGHNVYFEGIRKMYGHLYEAALIHSNRDLFLDKTPRYYLIIPELREIFPRARFLFLLRNPLAVLHSIVKTWPRGYWKVPRDFMDAPMLIMDGISLLRNEAITVHYEKILVDPVGEISKLCQTLGIEFEPQMIKYRSPDMPRWSLGDPHTIYEKSEPDKTHSDLWLTSLRNPQMWRIFDDYLDYLGPDLVVRMGYDFEELRESLVRSAPHWYRLLITRSLSSLIST